MTTDPAALEWMLALNQRKPVTTDRGAPLFVPPIGEHAHLPGYVPPTAIPAPEVSDPRERDHLAHLHEQLDTARALGEPVEARIRYVRACAVALGGA